MDDYVQLVEDDYAASRWIAEEPEFWFTVLRLYPDLKGEVALNKVLPDEVLVALASDRDDRVRSVIAQKRRLPRAVFEQLSSDENESVRLRIAVNPKCPIDILQRMKEDTWEEVRVVVDDRLSD